MNDEFEWPIGTTVSSVVSARPIGGFAYVEAAVYKAVRAADGSSYSYFVKVGSLGHFRSRNKADRVCEESGHRFCPGIRHHSRNPSKVARAIRIISEA